MDASGFTTLATHFPDRTVATYDPRGLGRSTRKDGRVEHSPAVQTNDVHALIEALGAGPVEIFAITMSDNGQSRTKPDRRQQPRFRPTGRWPVAAAQYAGLHQTNDRVGITPFGSTNATT
jgi:hypothetical protein